VTFRALDVGDSDPVEIAQTLGSLVETKTPKRNLLKGKKDGWNMFADDDLQLETVCLLSSHWPWSPFSVLIVDVEL
jgi:hypothetical protein